MVVLLLVLRFMVVYVMVLFAGSVGAAVHDGFCDGAVWRAECRLNKCTRWWAFQDRLTYWQ